MTGKPRTPRPTLRERARAVVQRLRGGALSPGRAAASVGLGLFVGMWPVYGVQFFVLFALCVPLRLDLAVAYLAAHVSNPLTLPFLLALELEVGSLVLHGHHAPDTFAGVKELGAGPAVAQVMVGSLLLGSGLGILGAVLTWFVAQRARDSRSRGRAAGRRRTIARYAGAPANVRLYVRGKLMTDPAFSSIVDLGPLGRVVDAGCGYGQFGLGLLDVGNATKLLGIDDDAARISFATKAAAGEAEFVVSSLETAEFPEADAILFVDSLHYLDLDAQNALLGRAARALAPGGRLVVREVDARPTFRSVLTRWLETRAMKKRRGAASPAFRPSKEIAASLFALGLTAEAERHRDWSLFDNVLVVGRKPGGETPADPDGSVAPPPPH